MRNPRRERDGSDTAKTERNRFGGLLPMKGRPHPSQRWNDQADKPGEYSSSEDLDIEPDTSDERHRACGDDKNVESNEFK